MCCSTILSFPFKQFFIVIFVRGIYFCFIVLFNSFVRWKKVRVSQNNFLFTFQFRWHTHANENGERKRDRIETKQYSRRAKYVDNILLWFIHFYFVNVSRLFRNWCASLYTWSSWLLNVNYIFRYLCLLFNLVFNRRYVWCVCVCDFNTSAWHFFCPFLLSIAWIVRISWVLCKFYEQIQRQLHSIEWSKRICVFNIESKSAKNLFRQWSTFTRNIAHHKLIQHAKSTAIFELANKITIFTNSIN